MLEVSPLRKDTTVGLTLFSQYLKRLSYSRVESKEKPPSYLPQYISLCWLAETPSILKILFLTSAVVLVDEKLIFISTSRKNLIIVNHLKEELIFFHYSLISPIILLPIYRVIAKPSHFLYCNDKHFKRCESMILFQMK